MGLSSLLSRKPLPQSAEIETKAGPVCVTVKANPRARSYRLSISARGEPVLTIPKGGRWTDAEAFLTRNRGWLEARLAKRDSPYCIEPGGLIPLRGIDHKLVPTEKLRGRVTISEGYEGWQLNIPGGPEHMRRRLTDWLKGEAAHDLELSCDHHAKTLGVSVASIRLRDQSTRWGSCSSARALNFNWRLVLAPPFVLDYVAAHEVAHILEMNHRPVFWRTVERTLPDYERGKSWLKANGAKLMAI